MNTIKYVTGDLFAGDLSGKLIAHVCNDRNRWGAGFVVPLGKRFPAAKSEYHQYCQNTYQDILLGTNKIVTISHALSLTFVANMIAQTLTGKERELNYSALVDCMRDVAYFCHRQSRQQPVPIIAPQFGAGLAGGKWEFIEALIEDIWLSAGLDVTIYIWPPPGAMSPNVTR